MGWERGQCGGRSLRVPAVYAFSCDPPVITLVGFRSCWPGPGARICGIPQPSSVLPGLPASAPARPGETGKKCMGNPIVTGVGGRPLEPGEHPLPQLQVGSCRGGNRSVWAGGAGRQPSGRNVNSGTLAGGPPGGVGQEVS